MGLFKNFLKRKKKNGDTVVKKEDVKTPDVKQPDVKPGDAKKNVKKAKGEFKRIIRKLGIFAVVLALVVGVGLYSFLDDCYVTVDKDEAATMCVLGKYWYTVGPGFHLKVPMIVTCQKTSVKKIRRIEVGFRTIEVGPPAKYKDVPIESNMLTGDENFAVVDFIVQYNVKDVYQWQFKVEGKEELLNLLAQASMRHVVGYSEFDRVATYGKFEVQEEVKVLLQELVDTAEMGARVVAVQIQDAPPPDEVMPAFQDVVAASEDKERSIHDAQRYENKVVPVAKGRAAEIVNQAKGYAAEIVKAAKGDAERWTMVLDEYMKNEELSKARLTYETLRLILEGSDVLINMDNNPGILKHLDLNRTTAQPQPVK